MFTLTSCSPVCISPHDLLILISIVNLLDDTDEADGLIGKIDESLIGKTRSDKLVIFWVSYLDHQQRVLLFTQDERVAKGARKVMFTLTLLFLCRRYCKLYAN